MNNSVRRRLRYKVFTSFALFALVIISIVRLWSVAPPSVQMAPAYATAVILALAALWRGVILVRAARTGAGS